MKISSDSKNCIAGEPYRAKDFSKYSSAELSLKIHVSSAEIDYLIADKKSNRVLLFQPYQNASSRKDQSTSRLLESALTEDELLNSPFAEKQVRILTTDFTLLPKEFSEAHVANEWQKKFTTQNQPSILCRDKIEELNLEIAYAVPTGVMNLLHDAFNDFKLQHSITNQIRSLALRHDVRAVYCSVQSGFLQIIYLNSSQLMFANIFPYQSAEDFIYFLLAVYNQQHLDPENVKVILFGEIMKDSAMFHLAYKYIRNIEFGSFPSSWKFDDYYPFPPHFYFSLFCS